MSRKYVSTFRVGQGSFFKLLFRGHLTKHQSGTDQKSSMNPLLMFHAQKFNAMSWVTQLSEKIEWLRKGLEGFYPKTRKYRKGGLTTVSRGHDHLYLKCSWPLQEHRGFSCCHCWSVQGSLGAQCCTQWSFRIRMCLSSALALQHCTSGSHWQNQQDTADKRSCPFPCPCYLS